MPVCFAGYGICYLGPVSVCDISLISLKAKHLEAMKDWEPVARGRNHANDMRRDRRPSKGEKHHIQNSMSIALPLHPSGQLRCWPVLVGTDAHQPRRKQDMKGLAMWDVQCECRLVLLVLWCGCPSGSLSPSGKQAGLIPLGINKHSSTHAYSKALRMSPTPPVLRDSWQTRNGVSRSLTLSEFT